MFSTKDNIQLRYVIGFSVGSFNLSAKPPARSDTRLSPLRRQTSVWLNETRFWWLTTCYMKQRPVLQLVNKTIVVVRNDHEQLIFIFSLTKCYSDTLTAVLLKITILFYIM